MIETRQLQFRLRLGALLAAAALGWFSLATLSAEWLAPASPSLFGHSPSSSGPARPGSLSDWSVAIAPLRGDLLARVAVADAAATLDRGQASSGAGARAAALSTAQRSLALSPHDSRTWLLIALLLNLEPSHGAPIAEALRMSYLTSPADPDLAPTRLMVFATSGATADTELADLARADLRLILVRRPDLKNAILKAYESGSNAGKSYINEAVRSLDPRFAATLR